MSTTRPLKLLHCPRCGTPLHIISYRILECTTCDAGYDLDEVDYASQEPVHFLEVPVAPEAGLATNFPALMLPEDPYVYCERQTGQLGDWR